MIKAAEVDPSVIKHAVADVVDEELSPNESICRVYATKLMYILNGGLVEQPQHIFVADIMRRRPSDGIVTRRQRQYMLVDDRLVPLNTHSRQHKVPNVHTVHDTGDVIGSESLSQYIVSRLPEKVVLTRVLSLHEAKKFIDGEPAALGSSYAPYWENVLHTAVHNVSSEFENLGKDDAYGVAIKMHISKLALADLVDSNEVRFDSYDWVFKERAEDSPLPFDTEATFSFGAIATAVDGYKTWAEEEGIHYFQNPFHTRSQ